MSDTVKKQNELFEKFMIDDGWRMKTLKKSLHPELSAVKNNLYSRFDVDLAWQAWLQSWRVNEAITAKAMVVELPPVEG